MNNKNNNNFFVGIGAHKAASTWIYKCLQEHPEICMSLVKETNFFLFEKEYIRGYKYYEKNWDHCSSESRARGEFSVDYLISKESAGRIKKYNPRTKLIVSLRNPVDRLFSNYMHLATKGYIDDSVSMEDAIKKYPELIERGMYYKYLSHYLKYYSIEDVCIVLFEDIEKDPKKVLNKLFKFLNVDNEFVPTLVDKKYHTTKERSAPFYFLVARSYVFLKNKKVGAWLIKFLKFFGFNAQMVNKILKILPQKKYKFNKVSREQLISIFRKDIMDLEKLIKRDLSYWLK